MPHQQSKSKRLGPRLAFDLEGLAYRADSMGYNIHDSYYIHAVQQVIRVMNIIACGGKQCNYSFRASTQWAVSRQNV